MTKNQTSKIAFQGKLGAYSHIACQTAYPKKEVLPCPTFADAFDAVEKGRADLAMIPIDNSIAGRVADIHHLLPRSKLSIIQELFIPIHHCLLATADTKISDIKTVYSHVHALPQCRKIIGENRWKGVVFEDTGGSAQKVAEMGDKTIAAIASAQAAEIYGLKILKKNIEDESGNTTRFIVLSRDASVPSRKKDTDYMTSILFRVRNIPAALYKGLGGFATNGINITKLESYLEGKKFHSASFYSEVDGHPDEKGFKQALEELRFYAEDITMLGTYVSDPWRRK